MVHPGSIDEINPLLSFMFFSVQEHWINGRQKDSQWYHMGNDLKRPTTTKKTPPKTHKPLASWPSTPRNSESSCRWKSPSLEVGCWWKVFHNQVIQAVTCLSVSFVTHLQWYSKWPPFGWSTGHRMEEAGIQISRKQQTFWKLSENNSLIHYNGLIVISITWFYCGSYTWLYSWILII